MKSFKINQAITDRQYASLSKYFKEVSKQPLLSIEEEVELARQIKEGSSEALNKLISSNLRFVISVAKQYQNKGLDLVDLIQEGNMGLMEAALKYDETRGFKFISYAVWWIRQSIMYALSNQCRTIRVPMNQIVYMNKINKASEKLEQVLNRAPSVEEISSEIDLDSSKVNLTLTSINKALSLNTPFNTDEEGCLLDVIPNENSSRADDNILNNSKIESINKVLKKLSNREEDILRMIFGLGVIPMTLEEIAGRFGIGPERARQIQHEALEKIRMNYIDDLKELL